VCYSRTLAKIFERSAGFKTSENLFAASIRNFSTEPPEDIPLDAFAANPIPQEPKEAYSKTRTNKHSNTLKLFQKKSGAGSSLNNNFTVNPQNYQSNNPMSIKVDYLKRIRERKKQLDYEAAIELYRDLVRRGIEADGYIYAAILPVFVHLNNMDEAAQIVKSIDATKMKSDMILASQVMLYHIKSGDLKGGLQLLREIAATVSTVPESSLRELLRLALHQADHAAIIEIFQIMKQHFNLTPDSYTVYSLFLSFYQRNNLEAATKVFDELKRLDLHHNYSIYKYLLKLYATNGRASEAEAMLNTILESPDMTPQMSDFTALIRMYIYQFNNHASVDRLYRELLNRNVVPDAGLYESMMDLHVNNGEVANVLNLVDEIKSRDFKLSQHGVYSLMRMYFQIGQYDHVIKVAEDGFESGIRPTVLIWSLLLRTHAQNGTLEQLQSVATTLNVPREMQLLARKSALESSRNLAAALTLFDWLRTSDEIGPDINCYNVMLRLFIDHGEYAKAEQFSKELGTNTWSFPNLETKNLLLELASHLPNSEEKIQICLKGMLEQDLTPNSRSFYLAMKVFAKNGNTEQVQQLRNEMYKCGIKETKEFEKLIAESSEAKNK
jgi:tetratricopeptide (TPR) repeat protein